MSKPLIAFAVSLALTSTHLLAATLDCKVTEKVPFKAELEGTGNGRSVTVTFAKKPNAEVAARIVRACMQVAVTQDPTHELLGSAWVGEEHFELTPKKDNLAYFPAERKIRPFGFDDALKGLKLK
jgi:hypothetical protein